MYMATTLPVSELWKKVARSGYGPGFQLSFSTREVSRLWSKNLASGLLGGMFQCPVVRFPLLVLWLFLATASRDRL